jgi:hypothetical protein
VLSDPRDPRRVHFTLHDLLKQRVLQIAAGYDPTLTPARYTTDIIIDKIMTYRVLT